MKTKKCTKCKQIKLIIEFCKCKRITNRDGFRAWCKECEREYERYYCKRPYRIKKKSEWDKKNYKENICKIRERVKNYKRNNKEKISKLNRKYRKENPEKVAFSLKRARLMRRKAEGSHTLKEWQDLKAYYGNTCLRCKKPEPQIKLTEDHIISIINNGTDDIDNIQPLCRSCNSSKNSHNYNYRKEFL